MKKYDSFTAYRSEQSNQAINHLDKIQAIMKSLPYYEENMSYGVPAFNLKENAKHDERVMVTCYKNHISLYPHKETINLYKTLVTNYLFLKGTIQIQYDKSLDEDLIHEIVLHSYDIVNKVKDVLK